MTETVWRNVALGEALARPEIRARAEAAAQSGPLCDACLGRLFANVDTGLSNAARGRMVREALEGSSKTTNPPHPAPLPQGEREGTKRQGERETMEQPLGAAPPAATCHVCGGLFAEIAVWVERARQALGGLEFDTLLVTSHPDPAMAAREQELWDRVGGDPSAALPKGVQQDRDGAGLAEPYRQAFNREVGGRLCDLLGVLPEFVHPDVVVLADHALGTVTAEPRPLYVGGRYRKLVRGLPQCRWAGWPTSIQDLVGGPILRAAEGADHVFHGCGREDTDVRCLGERPFVLEVLRPKRRRLDWAALETEIAGDGRVEVRGLGPCSPSAPADLKALRPEKTYRALVHLSRPVGQEALAHLAGLEGVIRQRTPRRVARRRPDRVRGRRVRRIAWRVLDPQTLEVTVRTTAGLYVKELVSGDGGRTRPSVAEALGVAAECTELDVLEIHVAP